MFQRKISRRSEDICIAGQPSSSLQLLTLQRDAGLSEQDIDEVVIFLLEKLNDYSDELNRLSTAKESIEKEIKCLHRRLLKQTSKIKQTHGKCCLHGIF